MKQPYGKSVSNNLTTHHF